MRHLLYRSKLSQIKIGRYHNVDCLKYLNHQSELESHPFSIYPGIGLLPLELVHPGNHNRLSVPWSIAFHEETATQLAPFFQTLNVNPLQAHTNSKYLVFELGQSIQEGEIYKIELGWSNDSGPQTAQAYLGFTSCGYLTPNSACHPADPNPCPMPGFGCTNRLNKWTCSKTGPIDAYEEGCMNAGFSCKSGLICVGTESVQDGMCVPYCHRSPEQANSCDQVCGDLDVASGILNGTDFGYCLPSD